MKHTSKHPGFKAVAKGIAKKEGIPMKNASAILASAGRKAGKKAVMKNPNLKKIKGYQYEHRERDPYTHEPLVANRVLRRGLGAV